MKKIVVETKRTVQYQCEVCKTLYKTPAQAKKCEARPVEKKKFRVGQLVRALEVRVCHNRGEYFAIGKVIKIRRPELPDYEYECKWLGGEKTRLNSHVRLYEIEFICPRCGKIKDAIYYAPELIAR